MLNIKIICVGKIREKSLKELCDEYSKRISKYAKLEIIELDDEKIPANSSDAIEEQVKTAESNKIIERLNKYPNSEVILLDLKGKELGKMVQSVV